MKRYFIIHAFILLVVSTDMLHSQRIIITNDSLRNRLKYETSSDVLSYYLKNSARIINYKDLYNDKISKDSLLRWLDEDVIVNYKINKRKQYLIENFNEEEKKSFTEYYVTYDIKLNFDSIYLNPKLYELYHKLAVDAAVDEYRNDILKGKEKLLPPSEVLYLHSKIAYPESYKKIKQWWYLDNKSEKSCLFDYILKMNDTEAIQIFDKIIADAIKNNGKSIYGISFIFRIKQIENAYAVKKLLEMLSITKEVLAVSEDPLIPLDSFTFDALLEMLEKNNIEGDFIPYSQQVGMGTLKSLKYARKHKEKIIEAAKRLIKKLKSEEQYWMENMPFDYVPDISNNN